MKRLFKFFAVAAIIAVGFTGCSSETPIDDDPQNGSIIGSDEEDGELTYASFRFSASSAGATRSVDAAGGETTLALTEYRVLIYRGDNTLEIDTAIAIAGDSMLTIPVYSGSKKLFVIANGGTTTAILSVPAKGTTTLNTYAGLNNAFVLTTGSPNPTDFSSHTLLYGTNGSKFIFSSDVKTATKDFKPGISAAESKVPGSDNFFNVGLDRLVARVAVTKTDPSKPTGSTATAGIIVQDSTGRIDPATVQYHLWNINKAVYPFQNYNASNVLVTPYGDAASPFESYYLRNQGEGSSNNYIAIATRGANPPATSAYRYVTENVPTTAYGGNTTYAEVEAVFLPVVGKYVDAVIGYNEATSTFSPVKATADQTTATDLYKFIQAGVLGLEPGTILGGSSALLLAKKVVYHLVNPSTPPKTNLSDYTSLVADADVLTYFDKYTGGKSYYRLNFGEQNGQYINYGIKRNYYYDANITGFNTIGANEPGDLLEDGTPLGGITNITVHIIIRDWTGKEMNVII
ncbi:MAG: Mfa1 family fimbria major subunit [Tannerellaceae bacterium]|nr:Mfa1 family fimbria major subunit [Tannerellaceae bacterium]